MAELKTFLFTDIVGSVELKREMPGHSDADRDEEFIERILRPHRERIERALAALGGRVVSTAGDGHFLVFSDTISAARWSVGIQRLHRDEPIHTPRGSHVAVRISMHLGIPQRDPHDHDNFVGKPVDYAARLNDYATGGQILVSRSVVAVLEDAGMDDVSFHHHGRRQLRGIGEVDIYELIYDGQAPRKMRPQPRETHSRQWTVLPATMGLTEFHGTRGRRASQSAARLSEGSYSAGGSLSARSQPHTDVVPLRLGNYELEQRLGSGGMGDVYRARHTQFGRVRAVKVIKQHFVDSGHQEVIRRFYQEIKAVGALEHPNIVVAIDSSAPTDSIHYLVMEYIEGMGAFELVTQYGPLPVAEACEIARQAARGLAYIHAHGMVHRDVKPSNLMVTLVRKDSVTGFSDGGFKPEGGEQAVVKILDLGLALLVGEDQQRLTMFDQRAMGTAMYMSPEQWKTTSVDIRADIYSLGCTLYHLLAGKPPFWQSDLKPEKAHEREKLPPIESGNAIPRGLWDVLQKMTAKNPNERYGDPADVAAALAPFAQGQRLADLVREALPTTPHAPTHGVTRSETLVAPGTESDTRPGRAPAGWKLPKTLPPVSRQKLWKAATTGLMLAAVVVIGWLAIQATGRRQSVQEARIARGHALQVAAGYAASEIVKEINHRFDILSRLAADEELRRSMEEILLAPDDEELWKPLENWLGARKADHDRQAPADSWFINDVRGVQIARSPRSPASGGGNYAHRDYFHGQGIDLPEKLPDFTPFREPHFLVGYRVLRALVPVYPAVREPHLSAVYRSTSSGHLKVAFSVPIENGRRGDERGAIGVLAMSVDLGEFNFEKQLPPGQEVVLIDLRPAAIDGETRRGLVLHHQRQELNLEGEPPPWVASELLARVDQLLSRSRPNTEGTGMMLADYRDEALTADELYWGALQRILDRDTDGRVRDTRWLVLVQEPLER